MRGRRMSELLGFIIILWAIDLVYRKQKNIEKDLNVIREKLSNVYYTCLNIRNDIENDE